MGSEVLEQLLPPCCRKGDELLECPRPVMNRGRCETLPEHSESTAEWGYRKEARAASTDRHYWGCRGTRVCSQAQRLLGCAGDFRVLSKLLER